MDRRKFLLTSAAASGAAACAPVAGFAEKATTPIVGGEVARGIPINRQSVSYWCYGYLPLPELLPELRDMGLSAIDLISPKDWPIIEDQGFTCSMAYGRESEDITTGYIDADRHEMLNEAYAKTMPEAARRGYKNMICFAGNRRGRYDLDGLRIAAKGLKQIVPIARDNGIVLQMELFNSKVNHPDYMADSSAWGIALCDMVDSEHFKLLYDIYHMQVQEGNIIQTIRDYHDYFGHYHTAGVPGRHELTDDQELNYPAVMRAIAETGYAGFVAHEFVPTYPEKLDGLREAIRVCG